MDFTREPIIETVITPKEGCTLVVRSSKSSGQEEYFVDAIEVVIFGNAIFFRSRERPKAFLVPATDYEVLEVRETRLVLKNVGLDRSIKIAGGREAPLRHGRDISGKSERLAPPPEKAAAVATPTSESAEEAPNAEMRPDARIDKKRDRRRNYRRRRGKDEEIKTGEEGGEASEQSSVDAGNVELPAPHLTKEEIASSAASAPVAAVLSSLLAPPPNLISETIARYKDNALFKGAFFLKDEEEKEDSDVEGNKEEEEEDESLSKTLFDTEEIKVPTMSLDYPTYESKTEDVENPVQMEESLTGKFHEPIIKPSIAEEIQKENILEATEEAYGAKDALEEERLLAEDSIAKGSVSAEDPTIGEELNLEASKEALKEEATPENNHIHHDKE